jgi:hypothetical protein
LGPPRRPVATRTVASTLKHPSATGLFAVTLKLAHAYSSLASSRGGLSATVNLSFTATGRATLHQSIAVTFVRSPPARPRAKAGRLASHHRRKGRR